jgi:hypothetical protein
MSIELTQLLGTFRSKPRDDVGLRGVGMRSRVCRRVSAMRLGMLRRDVVGGGGGVGVGLLGDVAGVAVDEDGEGRGVAVHGGVGVRGILLLLVVVTVSSHDVVVGGVLGLDVGLGVGGRSRHVKLGRGTAGVERLVAHRQAEVVHARSSGGVAASHVDAHLRSGVGHVGARDHRGDVVGVGVHVGVGGGRGGERDVGAVDSDATISEVDRHASVGKVRLHLVCHAVGEVGRHEAGVGHGEGVGVGADVGLSVVLLLGVVLTLRLAGTVHITILASEAGGRGVTSILDDGGLDGTRQNDTIDLRNSTGRAKKVFELDETNVTALTMRI